MNTYAASIVSVTSTQGTVLPILHYTVNFNKNSDPFSTVIFDTSDTNSLDGLIEEQILTYQKIDSLNSIIANPPSGSWTAPTNASLTAQQTYQQNLNNLQSMQVLVNLGVILNTDTNYVALLATVKSQYQASYYGF